MVDARFLFTALNVGWLRHVSEQPMRRRRHCVTGREDGAGSASGERCLGPV